MENRYIIFTLALCWGSGWAARDYKPVVLIHGLKSDKYRLNYLETRISQKHPGTRVYNLNLFPDIRSLENMWKQVNAFRSTIEELTKNITGKFNLIGYSQGGLIARGVIQSWPNHRVNNFISLSSPQAGQFGDGFLHIFSPILIRNQAYRIFYSRMGQRVSVGNYWNDPHKTLLFLQWSQFLARINNLVLTGNSTSYKEAMLKLNKLILIGGPDDGVIGPWQSAHFGFYDKNLSIVPMEDRDQYVKDLIGLRTLDKRSDIVIETYSGVTHHNWHHTDQVIDEAILPYLD